MRHDKRLTHRKLETRLRLIEPLIFRQKQSLPSFAFSLNRFEEPARIGIDVDDSDWPPIEPGSYWGQWLSNFTLRTSFTVPADWPQEGPIALTFDIGEVPGWDFCHPEALVYIDGIPFAALDKFHRVLYLPDGCRDVFQLPPDSLCRMKQAVPDPGARKQLLHGSDSAFKAVGQNPADVP